MNGSKGINALQGAAGTLAQASWLMAVVAVPLVIDPISESPLFAPKLLLTQMAGLTSLAAIFLRGRLLDVASFPPVLWALALTVVSGLSHVQSIDPSRHWETAPVVPFHPLTLICNVSLMASIAIFLRTREQLDRLISAIVFTGFALGAMALLQKYTPLAGEFIGGLHGNGSFAGFPTYLAGFLVMSLPLTVCWAGRVWATRGADTAESWKQALAISAVISVQIVAFVGAEKRGPVMGLFCGCAAAFFLWSAARMRLKSLRRLFGISILVALVLTGLATARKIGANFSAVPAVERLSQIVPLGKNTGDPVRASLWNSVADSFWTNSPRALPEGGLDRFAAWREYLGFGPDTLAAVLPAYWLNLPRWPEAIIEVSSHNLFWDLALSLGLAGLLVFAGMLAAIFQASLPALGASPGRVWLVLASGLAGATLLGITFSVLLSRGYLGLGAQAGFVVGIIFMFWAQNKVRSGGCAAPRDPSAYFLLAAIFGFLVESGFLYPAAATSVLFWILAGTLCALPRLAAESHDHSNLRTARTREDLWATLIVTTALVGILYGMQGLPSQMSLAALLQGNQWLAAAILPVTVAGSFIIFASGTETHRNAGKLGAWLALLAISVFVAGNFALLLALSHANTQLLAPLIDLRAIALAGAIPVTASIAAVTRAMHGAADGREEQALHWRGPHIVFSCLAVFSLAWVAMTEPLRFFQSATAAGLAEQRERDQQYLYTRALELRPEGFRNRLRLSRTLPNKDDALSLLKQGIAHSEFNLLSAEVGHNYLLRADTETSEPSKVANAQKAERYLEMALCYIPSNEPALFDLSLARSMIPASEKAAEEARNSANAILLDKHTSYEALPLAPWGRFYLVRAMQSPETLRRLYAARAAMLLSRDAADKRGLLGPSPSPADETMRREFFFTFMDLGHARQTLGDDRGAFEAYNSAVELGLSDAPYDPKAFRDALLAELNGRSRTPEPKAEAGDDTKPLKTKP